MTLNIKAWREALGNERRIQNAIAYVDRMRAFGRMANEAWLGARVKCWADQPRDAKGRFAKR